MNRKTATRPTIHPLVAALNQYPGIWASTEAPETVAAAPRGQAQDGYCVHFKADPGPDGETSLQFLSWVVNNVLRQRAHGLVMYPTSLPPYLSHPGGGMYWVLECRDGLPAADLAAALTESRKNVYRAFDEIHTEVVNEEMIYDMRLWAERVLNKGIDGNQFAKCVRAMQESGREQSAAIRNICRLIKTGRKRFSPSKIANLLTETADRYEALFLAGHHLN